VITVGVQGIEVVTWVLVEHFVQLLMDLFPRNVGLSR
jgi:hypothetical protein